MDIVNKMLSGFAILMSLILAYFLQFEGLMAGKMSLTKQNVLVGILVAYALFRTYRLYLMIKKSKKSSYEK